MSAAETRAIALRPETVQAIVESTDFREAQVRIIQRHLFRGDGDDADLVLFAMRAHNTGLDPFAGQIMPVFRWDAKQQRKVMAIQTGIDGFRLIGHRALGKRFRGMAGPLWKAMGSEWTDLWEGEGLPYAAKVGIWIEGCPEPTWGIAKWDEFKQTYRDKEGKTHVAPTWSQMPAHMLAKCAEAQAWRKVAPIDTANLRIAEEVEAADSASQQHLEQAARQDAAYYTPEAGRSQPARFPTVPGWGKPSNVFAQSTPEPTDAEYAEIEADAEAAGEPPEEEPEPAPEQPSRADQIIHGFAEMVAGYEQMGGAELPSKERRPRDAAVRDAILSLPDMDTQRMQRILKALTGKSVVADLSTAQLRVLESLAKAGKLGALAELA